MLIENEVKKIRFRLIVTTTRLIVNCHLVLLSIITTFKEPSACSRFFLFSFRQLEMQKKVDLHFKMYNKGK